MWPFILAGQYPAEAFIEELEVGIVKRRGRELPGFLKYSVCESYIQELVGRFQEPTTVCLDSVSHTAAEVLGHLATEHLKSYPELEARVKVGDHIQEGSNYNLRYESYLHSQPKSVPSNSSCYT